MLLKGEGSFFIAGSLKENEKRELFHCVVNATECLSKVQQQDVGGLQGL